MAQNTSALHDNRRRVGGIVVLLALALFGIYRYSTTADATAQAATTGDTISVASSSSGAASGEVDGGVQKINVNVGSSGYEPNVVKLKAGVPTEITFGQSQGCTGSVQSQDLGFQADLTAGPQTVKLPALQAGTYGFACGMGMVTGQIVVQ
jgi:plastocyanin domain-containing protein